MFELRGRNYVVTGGAQGIGFAVTRAICEMGGNVAVLDIQDKPVDEKEWAVLGERFGARAVYIQTDVTRQESLVASFARAVQELGSLDGLVPAAGIAIDKPFVDQTWEEFTRIQEVNVSIAVGRLHLGARFADAPGSRSEARSSPPSSPPSSSCPKARARARARARAAASSSSPRSRATSLSRATGWRRTTPARAGS